MNLSELTTAIQNRVGAKPDGVWGTDTASKVLATFGVPAPAPALPVTTGDSSDIDQRSLLNINTLQLWVRPLAIQLLRECRADGIIAKVTDAWRTDTEQNRLYEQGRTKPGKIVTHARAGFSNHNYGIAFDLGIFDETGRYLDESPLYARAGVLGIKLGLTWGGDWHSPDEPHFELRPKWASGMSEENMLSELRARKARGENYQ